MPKSHRLCKWSIWVNTSRFNVKCYIRKFVCIEAYVITTSKWPEKFICFFCLICLAIFFFNSALFPAAGLIISCLCGPLLPMCTFPLCAQSSALFRCIANVAMPEFQFQNKLDMHLKCNAKWKFVNRIFSHHEQNFPLFQVHFQTFHET